jgi:hypothetical protein
LSWEFYQKTVATMLSVASAHTDWDLSHRLNLYGAASRFFKTSQAQRAAPHWRNFVGAQMAHNVAVMLKEAVGASAHTKPGAADWAVPLCEAIVGLVGKDGATYNVFAHDGGLYATCKIVCHPALPEPIRQAAQLALDACNNMIPVSLGLADLPDRDVHVK